MYGSNECLDVCCMLLGCMYALLGSILVGLSRYLYDVSGHRLGCECCLILHISGCLVWSGFF